jgi:hypothetical protein
MTTRRLMVAVAVIANLLGAVAWYVNLARAQQRAVILLRTGVLQLQAMRS